jgi:hypothetical protein
MPLPGLLRRCELAAVNFWFGALAPHGLHPTKNSALHYDNDEVREGTTLGLTHCCTGRRARS